ncbi:MAG: tetratricopeptide repeat protein, partial [Bacteroidota bacterium]
MSYRPNLLLLLLGISFSLSGQSSLDSLRQLLRTASPDTNRVLLLNDLAYELTQRTDHSLAWPYIREAASLAAKLTYPSGRAGALFNEALVHYYDDAYKAAAEDFRNAALLNESINDLSAAASCWNNLGNVYHQLQDQDQALAAQQKGLELRKRIGDTKAIGSSLLGIGITHYYERNYDEALRYYDEAIPYFAESDYQRGLAVLYNNRGLVRKKRGELALAATEILESARLEEALGQQRGAASSYTNVANVYDDLGDITAALRYHEKALTIKQAINYTSGIAGSLTNLANLYRQQKDYAQAARYQHEAIALKRTIAQPTSLLISLRSMGRIHSEQQQPDSAYHYFQEAWAIRSANEDERENARFLATIAEFIEAESRFAPAFPFSLPELETALESARTNKELTEERYLLKALATAAERGQRYQTAFGYLKALKTLEDSLYNETQYATVADLRERYETAEKERQLTAQQLELAQRKRTNQRLYGSLFLLSLILLALTSYFRQRQLLSRQRLVAVQQREQTVRLQSIVDGREGERRRVARDLHDGLGGLLSTVKFQLGAATETTDQIKKSPAYHRAHELLETACDEVRRIAHHLLPDALLQLGLLEASADLVDHFNRSEEQAYSMEVIGTPFPLAEEQNLSLYRILQEALQNV